MIVEVHNTHLERHLYTLRPRGDDAGRFVASMAKTFYVSPFIGMDGEYTSTSVTSRVASRSASTRRQEGPLLATSLVLDRRSLTNRSVVRMLLRHPFMTQRTIGLIHWHALHLWRRGAVPPPRRRTRPGTRPLANP